MATSPAGSSSANGPSRVRIRSHECEWQAPDLVIVRWRGVMEANDAIDVFGALREHCAKWERLLLLQDFRDLESIPLETRRRIHEVTSWMPLRGTGFFGASFQVRVVATMLMKVANLARPGQNPFAFFDDEAGARSFLDGIRDRPDLDEPVSGEPAPSHASIHGTRLDALLTALSCASVEEFDAPEAFLEPRGEDDFAVVESAFQIFIEELAITKIAMKRLLTDAETARSELQARLARIEEQEATIVELSTPMIEVWNGVLTLPVIGTLEPERTNRIMETLLGRIVDKRIHTVIVDLTGVESVEVDTADQLNRMAAAIGLLGAKCMLSGLTPRVAQTLATLHVDLRSVQTVRTLREGLDSYFHSQKT